MKKLLSLILIIILCCSISACGTPASSPELYIDIENFSEGLAWVQYGDSPKYWGCINREGKMLFQYSCNDIDDTAALNVPTPFSNGYSYLKSKDGQKIYVINKNGDLCSNYAYDEVVAHGDGYTVIQKHHSDYNTAYYLYTIYNFQGDVLDTYKTNNDSEIAVNYCGKGVFAFEDDYETKEFFFDEYYYKTNYFFSESKTWVKTEYGNQDEVYFYDNTALLEVNYVSGDYRAELIFMDTNGSITKVGVKGDYGWNFQTSGVLDNVCLLYDCSSDNVNNMVIYDLDTKSFKQLTDQDILSKINVEYLEKSTTAFNNNIIILKLVGKDNEDYIAAFDKEWSQILAPIKAESYSPTSSERFIVDDTEVYDTNCNIVYNINEKGYHLTYTSYLSSPIYSDNVLWVTEEENDISENKDFFGHSNTEKSNFAALDKDGNLLFDSIDTTNVITKSIE